MSAAMCAATEDAQRQVLAHESAGAEQQQKFTQMTEELTARTARVDAQWQAFRDAMELEQSQFTQRADTMRQELFDRACEQEKLVGSLNERLETMNQSLTNMVSDLGAARRYQARLGLLLAAMILLSLGLSATALWYALR
jgi:predicted acetyltransferase